MIHFLDELRNFYLNIFTVLEILTIYLIHISIIYNFNKQIHIDNSSNSLVTD